MLIGGRLMIHKLSTMISSQLVKHKIISEELEEIYIYGVEITISSIIGFIISAVIGLLFNAFIQTMIYYAVFVILRSMTGGYHASSYFKCNFIFSLITIFVIVFSKAASEVHTTVGTLTMLFLSAAAIFIWLAPIENPNKPIEKKKKTYLKMAAVITSVFLYVMSILLYINQYTYHASIIIITIFAVSMLCMLTVIRKGGRYDEKD